MFPDCSVFRGSTERVVKESLDYLSIKQTESNGKIPFKTYQTDSTKALKDFFHELNDYGKYRNFFSTLLQHQLFYEVARCCVVTNLCSIETDQIKIVKKCYDQAMNYIRETLKLIKSLNLDDHEKKYLICLNKRHRMILQILGGNVNEAEQTFKYIMCNMPDSNRAYRLMRLRTVFDFVCNWYIAKITYNFGDLSTQYLQRLRTEV